MLARTLLRRAAALPLRSTTSHIRRYTGPLPGLPQSSASSVSNTSATNATPPAVEDTEYAAALTESVEEGERARKLQAPNREKTWSRSQQAREVAMTGPRFEQTNMELQPRPYAAIELIHKVPVTFVPTKMAVCDGGGGPAGHPKIYINIDKPEIIPCGYCGLPFAHTHHKAHLESLPETSYPLA